MPGRVPRKIGVPFSRTLLFPSVLNPYLLILSVQNPSLFIRPEPFSSYPSWTFLFLSVLNPSLIIRPEPFSSYPSWPQLFSFPSWTLVFSSYASWTLLFWSVLNPSLFICPEPFSSYSSWTLLFLSVLNPSLVIRPEPFSSYPSGPQFFSNPSWTLFFSSYASWTLLFLSVLNPSLLIPSWTLLRRVISSFNLIKNVYLYLVNWELYPCVQWSLWVGSRINLFYHNPCSIFY